MKNVTLQELNTLATEVGAEMQYANHSPNKYDYEIFGEDFVSAIMINARVGENFICTPYCESTTQENINAVYEFLMRERN